MNYLRLTFSFTLRMFDTVLALLCHSPKFVVYLGVVSIGVSVGVNLHLGVDTGVDVGLGRRLLILISPDWSPTDSTTGSSLR